jgi:bacteriocin-like protein
MSEFQAVSESELQSIEGGALFVCAGGAAMSAITYMGLGVIITVGTACLVVALLP